MLLVSGCVTGSVRERGPRPNIVVYVVDTLRADRLGAYFNSPSKTPAIDRLAQSSIVFEQASAPAPWTLPSVASMLLSQLPCEHGVLADGDRLSETASPLASSLAALGYRTASFFANPYVGPMSGLDRGFEEVRLGGDADVEKHVVEWLASQDDERPIFLYVHTVEPHNPESAAGGDVNEELRAELDRALREYRTLTRVDYDAGQPLGTQDNTDEQVSALRRLDALSETIDQLYDAAISDADARFSRLRAALEDSGHWNDTLLVFVSDHGEELGDHGGWQHDQSVYEELMRVPLLVKLPADERAGERISMPVSLIDVVPTIMGYLEVEAGAEVRGRNLLEPSDDELRFVGMRENQKKFFRPYKENRGDINIVVRRGGWKGIWNAEVDTVELYDLSSDPRERDPAGNSDVTDAIRVFAEKELRRCRAGAASNAAGSEAELDEETRRHLESLGYVSGRKTGR